MVFAMARPVSRPGSSNKQFRKRVPAEIQRLAKGKSIVLTLPGGLPGQQDLAVSVTLGGEITFSLRTSDPALVRRRHAAAIDQLEAHFQVLCMEVRSLSHKERVAFSGLVLSAPFVALRGQSRRALAMGSFLRRI